MTQPDAAVRVGFFAAAAAYTLWGLLPLYLKLVGFAAPEEVLAHRVLWSLPAALLGVALMGGVADVRALVANPRLLRPLFLAALLLGLNWWVYVWAVAAGRILEASLAYFLTPLVNVAFGVAFFGERLGRVQIVALTLAAAGVIVQGVALAALPVVALVLCATWSCYGLVRKRASVGAAAGLLAETAILGPLAALGLVLLAQKQGGLAFDQGGASAALLALAGPATALPLLLFVFGARRLKFSTLGLLQYIAPTIQFIIGLGYGEPFTGARAASFVLIWAGLAIFSYDAMRSSLKA
jgi:chloramphenicol-sensitive protein RarD